MAFSNEINFPHVLEICANVYQCLGQVRFSPETGQSFQEGHRVAVKSIIEEGNTSLKRNVQLEVFGLKSMAR